MLCPLPLNRLETHSSQLFSCHSNMFWQYSMCSNVSQQIEVLLRKPQLQYVPLCFPQHLCSVDLHTNTTLSEALAYCMIPHYQFPTSEFPRRCEQNASSCNNHSTFPWNVSVVSTQMWSTEQGGGELDRPAAGLQVSKQASLLVALLIYQASWLKQGH